MPYLKRNDPVPEPLDCKILTAALDLIVERGFHSVSIHDIQKKANVSIGSIYNHFGGKEGVAKALYNHLLNEFEEMINDVIAEDISNLDRCNTIIRQLFEYTESKRNIISYVLYSKHREFLAEELPIHSSTPFIAMREIVEQGMAEGEIRNGNPSVVASIVFGAALRMIHLRLDGVIDEPLTNFADELIEKTWQGILPNHS
jgi:AcrR family transcriptional regulator